MRIETRAGPAHSAGGGGEFGETGETGAVLVSRTFAAPRKLVFDAWTQREHLLQWWGTRDYPIADVALDARPGGTFSLRMVGPAGEASASGTYEVVEPPDRLVTASRILDDAGQVAFETRLAVTLDQHAGYTRLTLATEVARDAGPEAARGAAEGWGQSLDRLAEHLVRVQAGPQAR